MKPLEKSGENTFELGGKGFKLRRWEPTPYNTYIMTIGKSKEDVPFQNIPLDRIDYPASRPRRPNWNLVNNTSLETSINLLSKQNDYVKQNVIPFTVLAENTEKNKWNEKIRKQKGIKLGFGAYKKKWDLEICKEIDIIYEQESDDDVIINDDYNNIQGPLMRPITATIIKINDEDDTSSMSSYDVFQKLIIKTTNYEFNLNEKNENGNPTFKEERRPSIPKPRKSNNIENEQKNKNDKSNLPPLPKVKIDPNNIMKKKKKLELIRDDEPKQNYLRV